MTPLLATDPAAAFGQFVLIGLVSGLLYALIALGYTMVYGIVELINFAHGDLFMLGCFLCLQVCLLVGARTEADAGTGAAVLAIALMLVAAPLFCAGLNLAVDRAVYKPLRTAPKLAPLVSAIGVSFVFMGVGSFWRGPTDVTFPKLLLGDANLAPGTGLVFTSKDLMVVLVTLPTMVALTLFVRYAPLGKAMRATAQNPTAAQLMGINVDRVIAATFALGGALAGVGAVVYCLYFNTVNYLMGFQNGVYAFTAAVLGGIGNIPGAVLGGIVIGLVKTLGGAYIGAEWSEALIFGILVIILIFRPNGLLGARTREKV
ncbi:MAG TPA: branched-chain amino acid ABC transporter permease [Urbifossiella sp.]|jgi:branched-chain amino acid transport system permease protein|nr:branched-chain amino acid ABC transporter permease [Urbifossiella sp.]